MGHAQVVALFEQSMPERYRAAYAPEAIREHAAIVARRAGLGVRVEASQHLADGVVVLCIVADDRPGLLSLISASLVAHGIDILTVRAYTRSHPSTGRAEAVDFMSVRRAAASALPPSPEDLARITKTLTALVTGEATLESILSKNRIVSRAPSPHASVRAAFGNPDQGKVVLTVETADRPGLLLAITQALFRTGVQIVDSDATTREGQVLDRFTLIERDGTPLGYSRKRAVQTAVVSAIEALGATTFNKSASPSKASGSAW